MNKERIGFVGVGRMGANMARRLKDCGFEITAIHDANQKVADELATELGAKSFQRLADVTAAADVIFTVVSNDESMRKIFLSKGDSLLTNAEGKVFVNCATLSPGIHAEVEVAAEKAGANTVEGCMASSISQARSGTLYLMCGGREEVFKKVEPILKLMSVNMRYCGATGRAAEVKALVNMVMNINTAGLAEGLGLAAALGQDLDLVREVFSQTGANSRVLETDGGDMCAREHDCWFSAEHAAKDSNIALDLAKAKGLTLPLAAATSAQYEKMVDELTFPGRALHK
jgi:3-hydroxyisobutyrate dehydrogenase